MNIYICLENIRSLHNVGAIFRTCSFFGISNIILLGYTAKPMEIDKNDIYHKEVLKTSLGSEKELNIIRINTIEGLLEYAKINNLKLISIEQNENSEDINLVATPYWNDSIVVFGNEVIGVGEEIIKASNKIVEIKKLGNHNSLNVATTCGIVLNKITS